MWEYNYEELYHHGVKGMKWGVRRAKKQAKSDLKSDLSRAGTKADKKAARTKYKNTLKDIKRQAKLGTLPVTAEDVKKHRRSKVVKATVGTTLGVLGAAGIGLAATYATVKAKEYVMMSLVGSVVEGAYDSIKSW